MRLGTAQQDTWLRISSAALSLHRRVLALAIGDRAKLRRRAVESVQQLHATYPLVPADFGGVTVSTVAVLNVLISCVTATFV
jgi:hypothetical protein